MASYDLTKTDETVLTRISDGSIDNTHASLTFVGKNVVNYGPYQNKSFLQLLENFANVAAPPIPLAGQIWYDSGTGSLKVYDATRWNQLPKVVYNTTATNQANGDFWFNTNSNQLFVKTGSTYTLVGPKSSANTAGSLENAVNINGVPFDGSQSITVTSTTTGILSTGSFITGPSFNGSVSAIWGVYTGPDNVATPSAVVARNSAGDIWYTVGHGIASSARYADLAEKYLADKDYEVGTVMVVNDSDESEVRASRLGERAIGVVSEYPAYLMNEGLEGGTAVALKGRVPVRVFGPVKKGDRLEAFSDGLATASANNSTNVFAVALESNTDDNLKINLIEAVIL
jgi:hypothetical protein